MKTYSVSFVVEADRLATIVDTLAGEVSGLRVNEVATIVAEAFALPKDQAEISPRPAWARNETHGRKSVDRKEYQRPTSQRAIGKLILEGMRALGADRDPISYVRIGAEILVPAHFSAGSASLELTDMMKEGKVRRVSPGMYMLSEGLELIKAAFRFDRNDDEGVERFSARVEGLAGSGQEAPSSR